VLEVLPETGHMGMFETQEEAAEVINHFVGRVKQTVD
jgi:hypothetical protein